MKALCSRSGLREALRIVSGVVDPRNIKPILKDIRLRTIEGGLELSATDLDEGGRRINRCLPERPNHGNHQGGDSDGNDHPTPL